MAPKLHGFADTLAIVSYIDPDRAALVGRTISAVFGAIIPLITYGIGRRAYGVQVAWVGAVFVAVSLLPVVQAHQALTDSTMAFCAALYFYFCWQIYERGRCSDYALAGIVAGLVVASKFNGAFTALAIPAASLMSCKSDPNFVVLTRPKLWLAITRAIVSLLAGSPYFASGL